MTMSLSQIEQIGWLNRNEASYLLKWMPELAGTGEPVKNTIGKRQYEAIEAGELTVLCQLWQSCRRFAELRLIYRLFIDQAGLDETGQPIAPDNPAAGPVIWIADGHLLGIEVLRADTSVDLNWWLIDEDRPIALDSAPRLLTARMVDVGRIAASFGVAPAELARAGAGRFSSASSRPLESPDKGEPSITTVFPITISTHHRKGGENDHASE